MMPKILSFDHKPHLEKDSPFKSAWDQIRTLDVFTRILVTTCLLIIFSTSYIVVNYLVFSSKAQENDNKVSQKPDDFRRPEPLQFISDQILVKFKSTASEFSKNKIFADHDATILDEIPKINVKVIKVANEKQRDAVIDALSHNPMVEYAEPNAIAEVSFNPNDTYFVQGFQWNMTKIQAPAAWDTTKGDGVLVAILDTGIDNLHPDLGSKIVASANFSDSAVVTDVNGHGSHVSGIAAAATNNITGVTGVGFNASLMNVKVMGDSGSGGFSWVAQGVIWATDHGAKAINMSLGAQFGSATLEDAINYAWSKGVVLTAAAGNLSSSTLFYPAAYPNVIAVASTDFSDNLAPGSDYGDWVDVAAPGGNIYSTLPGNRYASLSGTSIASPHVAGLAALVFARVTADTNGNGLLNDEVRSCIENNTDTLPISGIGHGRINASKAVACSGVVVSPTPTLTPAPTSIIVTPTSTATPTPILTPTNFPTPTPTRIPTPTSTPIPTPTLTPTPTVVPGDITAPVTSITSPLNGTTVVKRSIITITANATDNIAVSKVEFYVDGSLKCTRTISPYYCAWKVTGGAGKIYKLQSKSYDSSNNSSFSSIVSVTSR